MLHSHDESVRIDLPLGEPEFEGLRPPKSVQAFDWVKDPLVAKVNVITMECQSRACDRIRAFERSISALSTGIHPEPVAKMALPQLKRLGLIAVVKVIHAFD
jgi:hypothetical protein